MHRDERLSSIVEIVGTRERVEVDELAAELTVSAATIRRDLDQLAGRQLLARTRGGAVAAGVAYDLPLRHKTARHAAEKQRISSAAARLVQRGMVVALNGGTTTTEVARAIVTSNELGATGNGPTLTVVTNALNIAHELVVRPQVKLVVTGGVAREQSFELTGSFAAKVLEEITVDLFFLGVDAIDARWGAYAHHEGEAGVNRLMSARAEQVVVVADSSKLGRRAFAQICDTPRVDQLLTDSNAPSELINTFEQAGIRVHTV